MTYGCYNRRDYEAVLDVRHGWTADGRWLKASIPFTMTRECQYTHSNLGQVDKGCIGCRHRSMDLTASGDYDDGIDSPRGS